MEPIPESFAHDYEVGTVHFGRGCVGRLSAALDRRGLERALVVCGSTVGATPSVLDPVGDALGERLAGVFDRTTPAKHIGTAAEAAGVVRDRDVDVLVGVGGGSSLDVARWAGVLAADARSADEFAAALRERDGTVTDLDPESPLPPLFVVPTTMAGADMSIGAGIGLASRRDSPPTDGPGAGTVFDRRLMPGALFYDPELFATTPGSVLYPSAMNGFDKAVEMLYSRHATAITDATASRALALLCEALPALAAGDPGRAHALDRAVAGTILAQYGVARPDAYGLSIVHAFGHGFSRRYDVHQGRVHGVLAPHVLRDVFDRVDGRRRLLADALGVEGSGDDRLADGVVGAVTGVRDALGLPSRLRDLDGPERDDLPEVAGAILRDGLIDEGPPGLDHERDDVEAVLREAW